MNRRTRSLLFTRTFVANTIALMVPLQISCLTQTNADREVPEPVADQFTIAGQTLQGPVYITRVEIFKDGGTRAIEFTDVNGTKLFAYLDGRFIDGSDPEDVARLDEPRRFSIGDIVTSPTAKVLEIGGADERELHRLLTSCLDWAARTGQHPVRYDQKFERYQPDPERERQWLLELEEALEWHLQMPAQRR